MRQIMAIMVSLALMASAAYAGSKNLSETEMDEVSAQGLQTIENDNREFRRLSEQDNNLDSVQLEHNAQGDTHTGGIVNSAKSAVNASANIISLGEVTSTNGEPEDPDLKQSLIQTNTNTAANHENEAWAWGDEYSGACAVASNINKETQRVNNRSGRQSDQVLQGSVIDDQDNNNNSVQLVDGGQLNSEGISIINASTSAVNLGINIIDAGDLADTVTQTNTQYAGNMNNFAHAIAFIDYSAHAKATNAEFGATQVITNEPDTEIIGDKEQNQNNNNNSVQVNDDAQSQALTESIINSAQSAVNAAANLANLGNVSGASEITQTNDNEAKNHDNVAVAVSKDNIYGDARAYAKNVNKQTQKIYNQTLPEDENGGIRNTHQDNNNNSVQINNHGQENPTSVLMVNSSVSAVNSALNTLHSASLTEASSVTQSNTQEAKNMTNTATAKGATGKAMAANWEKQGATQTIENGYWGSGDDKDNIPPSQIIEQDNNNNSVQVNNHAQETATVGGIVNSAKSAVNGGANLAHTGDISGLSSVSQSNDNYAENHVNRAEFDGGEYGDGWAIAMNKNKQTQNVLNAEGTYEGELASIDNQDNNNNSVQVNNNGQREVTGLFLVNAAGSAVNDAVNALHAGSVTDGTVTQSNDQSALNYDNLAVNKSMYGGAVATNAETTDRPGQYIHNVHATIVQDNNNNSVQINDQGQRDITVGRVVNGAGSAVNVGSNLMAADAVVYSWIEQNNHQYASNHNNFAKGPLAIAGNKNKQTQTVENCFCTDLDLGHQNNNMNSVQLNDEAQRNMTAINAVNASHSAVNVAYNIMTASSVENSHIEQTNTNTAINFSNISKGGSTAIAGNIELGLGI